MDGELYQKFRAAANSSPPCTRQHEPAEARVQRGVAAHDGEAPRVGAHAAGERRGTVSGRPRERAQAELVMLEGEDACGHRGGLPGRDRRLGTGRAREDERAWTRTRCVLRPRRDLRTARRRSSRSLESRPSSSTDESDSRFSPPLTERRIVPAAPLPTRLARPHTSPHRTRRRASELGAKLGQAFTQASPTSPASAGGRAAEHHPHHRGGGQGGQGGGGHHAHHPSPGNRMMD